MAVILLVITASIKPGTIHPVVVRPDAVDEHLVEVAGLGAGRGDGHLPPPGGAAPRARSSPPYSRAWLKVGAARETNSSRSATSWRLGPDRGPGAALVAAVVEALQAVHFQRWVPAAVRPDFFIGARQIGRSLALGERDLTRWTISPRSSTTRPDHPSEP